MGFSVVMGTCQLRYVSASENSNKQYTVRIVKGSGGSGLYRVNCQWGRWGKLHVGEQDKGSYNSDTQARSVACQLVNEKRAKGYKVFVASGLLNNFSSAMEAFYANQSTEKPAPAQTGGLTFRQMAAFKAAATRKAKQIAKEDADSPVIGPVIVALEKRMKKSHVSILKPGGRRLRF